MEMWHSQTNPTYQGIAGRSEIGGAEIVFDIAGNVCCGDFIFILLAAGQYFYFFYYACALPFAE